MVRENSAIYLARARDGPGLRSWSEPMCGRYVPADVASMERAFHLGGRNWEAWIRRWNTAPTMPVPILVASATQGALDGHIARWGLIPHWWSKPVPPSLTFNARSEEAAQKPTWREALRSRRCLMPAVGWFEWNEQEPARTPSGRPCNQPYFIRSEEPVVAIAGLWSEWVAPSGNVVTSCALLTREAEGAAAVIHHRMPVVLAAGAQEAWLSNGTPAAEVQALMRGSRSDFYGYRVSTRVNSAKNEGEDLLAEIGAE